MKKFLFNLLCFLFCSYSYSQVINFPDTNLKSKLLEQNFGGIAFLDANNNNEIEVSEALNWTYSLQLGYASISDLTGIEYFTNVDYLYVHNNNLVTVDLSSLVNLKFLKINDNSLISLDVSDLVNLESIQCYNNQLVSLDFSGLTNITVINSDNNQLSSLILSDNFELVHLNCENNLLTSLDASDSSNLLQIQCSSNNLTTLNIKNDSVEFIDFSDNSSLQYVCVDGAQLIEVEDQIAQYGYTNCYANSLCSFNQGEVFYTLSGNVKYDENNDGCSSVDIDYKDLMLTVLDGTNSGDLYSNSNGYYHFNVQAGNYSITPTVPNATYFNISPTTTSVAFQDMSSPYIQDFCITPAGSYPDLKISIETIDSDYDYTATYRINYSNQGTMTQSGFVNLDFDDNVIDFSSANPMVSEQNTNELIWEFIDLKPFETRSIEFILDFNVPTINNGDVLNFIGNISSDLTEITPNDNVFNLEHTFQCCLLDVPSFEFSDYFIQYPNPTNDFLNLKMKRQIHVESIIIFDILGQEVKKVSSNNEHIKIDVSNLKSGHYFIKILASQKEFFTRFIRK
ncbi:putative secreted protein (Por secretion system target) [Jejuia pallidilutea]|uniref:Putative secreted protein (Por secretion system target) n=1 Tax=Jejuia pallidilutea TaxID=504487 RepID=A0A362WYX7_9FLAO|nr:T9SS type A sorting domain-containing protein [Jejuia pallidilutea]PQV47854.1 putative secreted protein (Por secretion system target) [Jejuia pallidilutea]